MTLKQRADRIRSTFYGVMDCRSYHGGVLGRQRDYPTAKAFWAALREYELGWNGPWASEVILLDEVIPVWLAYRVGLDEDGKPVHGFQVVMPGARGATPGWCWGGYVHPKAHRAQAQEGSGAP